MIPPKQTGGGASGGSFDQAFKEMFSVMPVSVDKHGMTQRWLNENQ
jgi:hypothetical protein